jgi:hypothetical protein
MLTHVGHENRCWVLGTLNHSKHGGFGLMEVLHS